MVLVFRQYFTLFILTKVVEGVAAALETACEEATPMTAAEVVAIAAWLNCRRETESLVDCIILVSIGLFGGTKERATRPNSR